MTKPKAVKDVKVFGFKQKCDCRCGSKIEVSDFGPLISIVMKRKVANSTIMVDVVLSRANAKKLASVILKALK